MLPNSRFNNIDTEYLLINQLVLERFTPRKSYDERYIVELADSIKKDGQLKPIIVRPHPSTEGAYEVIDGVHRVHALRKLEKIYVRAEIYHLDDADADFLAMKINEMHGRRLDEFEEGMHLRKILERYRWNQELIGEKYGRSQQWVSQRLKLARDSSNELIEALTTRVVNATIAREIVRLPKPDQPDVLEKVARDKLSSRETVLLIRTIKEHPEKKKDILVKTISELTPPPKDVQIFESKYGPERPKFEEVACPYCGKCLIVNWILGRINKAAEFDEN